jgi:hypothetical protein
VGCFDELRAETRVSVIGHGRLEALCVPARSGENQQWSASVWLFSLNKTVPPFNGPIGAFFESENSSLAALEKNQLFYSGRHTSRSPAQ